MRRLDVGQAAYLYRGGVTYVQVKRLTGRQAALAPAAAPAERADWPTLPLPVPAAAWGLGVDPGAPGVPGPIVQSLPRRNWFPA